MRPFTGALPRPGRALELTLFALLLLAALALRTHRLGAPTLSGDEWFMFRNYLEGPGWIVNQARTFEPHPLLYYLGFWAWLGLAGSTEWAMRYPSVLFGLLTCAAVGRLARDAAGPWVGLGALLLAAVNPYQIAQAQNARNYAMVAALATVATVLLLVADRRGGSAWYAYGLALLLALNTHLNAALAAAAHLAWVLGRWLVRGERPDPAAVRTGVVVAVLFAAWIAYSLPALTSYPGYFPEQVGFVEVLGRTFGTFAFGQTEAPRRLLVAAAAGAIAVGAVWALWRARRRDDAGLLVVGVALLPVVGTALMFLVRPMFEERYLIVAAPATIVLIAIGLTRVGRLQPMLGAAAVLASAYLSMPFVAGYYPALEASRPDWRSLAAWVASTAREGEVVLITGHGVADLYGYYGKAAIPTLLAADEATAPAQVGSLVTGSATGAYHLPYLEAPADQIARNHLVRVGFPAENRWFRNQRAEYFALPGRSPLPTPRPVGARWRGTVELVGAAISPGRVAPGDPVAVALEWRTHGDAPDLKESLRLFDRDGKQVAQLDRRPVDELRPFPTIKPGEAVRDGHALRLPKDAAPGPYEAALLLYDPNDGKAVAPTAEAFRLRPDNRDLVRLGSVEVAPR